MGKSALGILLSILIGCLLAPVAVAQNGSSSNAKLTVKKTIAKRSNAGKRVLAPKRVARKRAVATLGKSTEKLVKHVKVVNGKRKVVYQQVAVRAVMPSIAPVLTAGDVAGLHRTHDPLDLKSSVALVLDQSNSEVLFEKNSDIALPIASITKLMTGLVVVESRQNMDEILEITTDDIDREKNSGSRLAIGTQLSRASLLHLALMSSENRAASALGRNYPGGLSAFVKAMNVKAKTLGMKDTHYVDASGLSSRNIASARDLAKLVIAAQQHPLLGYYSTAPQSIVETNGRALQYRNTNHLVYNPAWEISLQKTGYISEAGRCLVMQTMIEGRSIVMVFLDSKGKQSRLADAGRIRKWLEGLTPQNMTKTRLANDNG